MSLLLFAVLSFIPIFMITLGVKILRADSSLYKEARELTKSPLHAIKGDIPVDSDRIRDYRVAAGMALDKTSNRIVPQGAISDEIVGGILRS